jgi:hypothetical protein
VTLGYVEEEKQKEASGIYTPGLQISGGLSPFNDTLLLRSVLVLVVCSWRIEDLSLIVVWHVW